MGDVVNLNRFKKQKAREERRAEADANRVKFGRTKAEKKQAEKEKELADKLLEGHKLDNT